jgi:hypothetical protein
MKLWGLHHPWVDSQSFSSLISGFIHNVVELTRIFPTYGFELWEERYAKVTELVELHKVNSWISHKSVSRWQYKNKMRLVAWGRRSGSRGRYRRSPDLKIENLGDHGCLCWKGPSPRKLKKWVCTTRAVLVQKLNNNSDSKCKSKSPKTTRFRKSTVVSSSFSGLFMSVGWEECTWG